MVSAEGREELTFPEPPGAPKYPRQGLCGCHAHTPLALSCYSHVAADGWAGCPRSQDPRWALELGLADCKAAVFVFFFRCVLGRA